MHPTIEDIYTAMIETDRGVKEKVRIYDTGGLVSELCFIVS
jgi:NF-kappa-B inhibitor-interacting Ras-like protein